MNTNLDQRRLYGDLAWTWPIISPKEDYVQEAEEICQTIYKHAQIAVKRLLHLGCGGGHLDFTLKKHLDVTSVDLSQDMLALAAALNPEVSYQQGDMRSVRLQERFDAVLIADSIDYMLTEADLRAAFETAWMHLKPGGVFYTYAEETRERFVQNDTYHSNHAQGDIEITFIENVYNPDPADSSYEMTFVYLIRRQGRLQVKTDRHLGGLFSLQTWLDLLQDVGFVVEMAQMQDQIPAFVGKVAMNNSTM